MSTTKYVLIDHENVSLTDVGLLTDKTFRVLVFVGAAQTKLSASAVMAIHQLGERAEYVQMSGSGPNSLDFHIAFYLGRLAQQDQAAKFHVVTKDKGFDPLITHLCEQGIQALRSDSIVSIASASDGSVKKRAPATSPNSTDATGMSKHIDAAAILGNSIGVKAALQQARKYHQEYLCAEKTTKPSKRSTLRSSINSFFRKQMDDHQIDRVVVALQTRGCLRFTGDKANWSI